MAAAKIDSKPADDWTSIVQRGIRARSLAIQYQADIDARLPGSVVSTLTADIAALGAVVPAAVTAREGAIQQTAAQHAALATCYELVTAARTAVKNHQPARDVSLAYGVGVKTNRLVVKDVRAAAQTIIDRVTAKPAEAKGFGIIAADVAALGAAIAALQGADQAQEAARAAAPLSTKERNTTARRIIASTKKIAGAGILAFAHDPTVRGTFEDLLKKTT